MNTSTWTKATIVMAIAVILAVAGFFYWKTSYTPPREEAADTEESTDLGSEIYGEITNPVGGELPDNPLKEVYKNPFE